MSAYDFNQDNIGKPLLYEDGSWQDIEQPLILGRDWAFEDSWPKLLERSGYELEAVKFGRTDAFRFDIHRARVEGGKQLAPHKYLINVEMGTRHYQHIYVDHFPCLMQLLRHLASIASAGNRFE